MGSIIKPGSDKALAGKIRYKASQELQHYNRALADARVQLTRQHRQCNAIEQQFEELSRATEQWLEQARITGENHEVRALGYLRKHNLAAIQLAALAQRVEQQARLLQRQRQRVAQLETQLLRAIRQLRKLDRHLATEQIPGKTVQTPETVPLSLLEPWELRRPQWADSSAIVAGIQETRVLQNEEKQGIHQEALRQQLAELLETDNSELP